MGGEHARERAQEADGIGRGGAVMLAEMVGNDRRRRRVAREARLVVGEEAARADDVGADGIEPGGELLDGDALAGDDPLQDPEVGRGEQADVLAVLPVDLLDALGDHQVHARGELAEGRRLAAGTAPLAEAADDHGEASALDRVLLDHAALQADHRVPTEGLVVIEADPARRDLVGADVVPELPVGVVVEVLALELPAQELGVFREVEDTAFEAELIGSGHRVQAWG